MPPKLIVEVIGDTSKLERSFKRAGATTGGLNNAIGSLRIGIGQLIKGTLIVDGLQKALEGLSLAAHEGISEFKEQAVLSAQTAAALKSTGGIAGVTAKQIDDLSQSLSNLSGIDDEVIKSAENVLLSFTNIRDSLGKGNDIFTQATKIVADYSARTGKDAPAAAVLFGKALEDPAKRVGILARAGVVLSTSQIKFIKSLEQSKGILAAQKFELGELTKRFGGAAKAAGETLPGQLNILRERFKDLSGSGIGLVAPALARATTALTGFVVKLSDTDGAAGKLRLIGATLRDQAERGFHALTGLGQRLVVVVRRELSSINWPQAITQAGRAVGKALVFALEGLASAVKAVNWHKVGKAITDGVAIAVAASVKFLASVDWAQVAIAISDLIRAAVKGAGQLFLGIGEEIANLIVPGIKRGLIAVGSVVEKLGLTIALKIVEPFSHLPGWLGGGPFQAMKASLQQTLDVMGQTGAVRGHSVGRAVAAGIQQGFADATAGNFGSATSGAGGFTGGPNTAGNFTGFAVPGLKPVGTDLLGSPKTRKGITADQRNTFFDNTIGRLLDQSQDGSLRQQIAKLKHVGDLITQRIAATKDVTRRLTLEQQLLDNVTRPLAQDRAQLRINDLAKTSASQFKRLGLSGTGDALIPGAAALKTQLGNVASSLAGSFLDTTKTKSLLSHIRQVLAGGLGAVGRDVRSKVKDILDGITQQLKDHLGDQTKFRHISSNAILASLGLTPEQLRQIRPILGQLGAGGAIPQRSTQFGLAGGGGFTVNGGLHLHGIQDMRKLEAEMARRNRSRANTRRG